MSCLVGEALAGEAPEGQIGALLVVDAELFTGVLPEVELGQIAVKVLLVDVLIDAVEAASSASTIFPEPPSGPTEPSGAIARRMR